MWNFNIHGSGKSHRSSIQIVALGAGEKVS